MYTKISNFIQKLQLNSCYRITASVLPICKTLHFEILKDNKMFRPIMYVKMQLKLAFSSIGAYIKALIHKWGIVIIFGDAYRFILYESASMVHGSIASSSMHK